MAEERQKAGRLPRNVLALGLVSLFNDASSEIVYPLLPLFLTATLGVGIPMIGLIEGVTESISSLLKLPAGWFSDRWGKRKGLVLWGYLLASLIRPLLALTTSAWQVLGLRFIDRIGKGLRGAPRDALIADSIGAESRGLAFGFHRAMDHLGAILGSLASMGLVVLFAGNYRLIFLAAGIPSLFAILILVFGVREGRREVAPAATSGSEARRVSFDLNFKTYLAVLLLFTLGNSSDAFLLLRARQSGIPAVMIPALWAALHLSKAVISVLGGGISDRWGRKRPIILGWIIYAAIYGGFAFASQPWQFWTLFIVYGCYFGLTEGIEKAFVADLVKVEQRGTAYGFYNFMIGIGALPASLATGLIWSRYGASVALGMGAALSLAASLLLATLVRESARRSS